MKAKRDNEDAADRKATATASRSDKRTAAARRASEGQDRGACKRHKFDVVATPGVELTYALRFAVAREEAYF
jgi:hypothetical protein